MMVMQMKNFQIELSEEVLNRFVAEASAKIADGRAVFTSHEEASKVMRDAKDRIKGKAAASERAGEYIAGVESVLTYQDPAIRITERIGDTESVMEFATAEDYKVWKSLNP